MLDVNFSLIRTGEPFTLKNHKMCLLLFQRSGSRLLRKSSGKGEGVGVCPRFHNVLRCVFLFSLLPVSPFILAVKQEIYSGTGQAAPVME